MNEAEIVDDWTEVILEADAPEVPEMRRWPPALAERGKRIVHLLNISPERVAAHRLYHWLADLAEAKCDPVWSADPILEYHCAQVCVFELMTRLTMLGQTYAPMRRASSDPLGFAQDAEAWIWGHLPFLDGGVYHAVIAAEAAVAVKN